jgi:hypothetical protein
VHTPIPPGARPYDSTSAGVASSVMQITSGGRFFAAIVRVGRQSWLFVCPDVGWVGFQRGADLALAEGGNDVFQSMGGTTEAICRDLAAAFRAGLAWKWDARFGTVLAEFPLESKASILGILDRHMVDRWDSASIEDAPEAAKKVKAHLGGLMAGQLLFLSDPGGDSLVYCAWWPWGNGLTISIRIGLFGGGSHEDTKQANADVLKRAFGIT